MPEYFFYHLERQSLEAVLPVLLEKTLSKGWRACVRCSSSERLNALDGALWTYRDDSFLPHGTTEAGFPERQPIYLTLDDAVPNGAQALFLLEEAEEHAPKRFERIVRIFSGSDDAVRAKARAEWQSAKANGATVSYWRQNDSTGSWERAG